jgi:hypothetical protein
MENNKIDFIEGKNMILRHTDNTACTESNMPPVETL